MSSCTDTIQEPLTVVAHARGDAVVVTLAGELTRGATQAWRDRLFDLATNAAGPVVLDLHELCFMSASGIGLLVDLHREHRVGALAAVSEPVRQLLRLTQVDTILPIWETVDDALAADAATRVVA